MMPRLNLNATLTTDDIAEMLAAQRPLYAVPGELVELALPEFEEPHAYQNTDIRALLLRVVDAANRIGLPPTAFSSEATVLLSTALVADGALPGFQIVENENGELRVIPARSNETIQ